MNEKPLERLNFFNGQRLQADDLRLEQDYHMRVRRWLNRSLYTSGIADGFEVHKVPNAPKVRVGPGLALDNFGREIISLEMQELVVPGTLDHEGKPTNAKRPVGLYLTVRYGESTTAGQDAVCAGPDRPASGGPSRVIAEPVFEWTADLPHEESGKVLLAFVGLGKGCREVSLIDLLVRPIAGPALVAKVRQYALEGAREIDQNNPAKIVFHVRGQQPTSITLFLRSESFPTYFYTELGGHTHGSSVQQGAGARTGPASAIDEHKHSGSTLRAESVGHSHGVTGFASKSPYSGTIPPSNIFDLVNAAASAILEYPPGSPPMIIKLPGAPDPMFDPATPPYMIRAITSVGTRGFDNPDGTPNQNVPQRENLAGLLGISVEGGGHGHPVSGDTGGPSSALLAVNRHYHSISATIDGAGVSSSSIDVRGRSGAPLRYVDDLHIDIDGRDVTAEVLVQIRSTRPTGEVWPSLGTGSAGDAIVSGGTGPIRLDYILALPEGEHVIKLIAPVKPARPNGGRIHFNLYIE